MHPSSFQPLHSTQNLIPLEFHSHPSADFLASNHGGKHIFRYQWPGNPRCHRQNFAMFEHASPCPGLSSPLVPHSSPPEKPNPKSTLSWHCRGSTTLREHKSLVPRCALQVVGFRVSGLIAPSMWHWNHPYWNLHMAWPSPIDFYVSSRCCVIAMTHCFRRALQVLAAACDDSSPPWTKTSKMRVGWVCVRERERNFFSDFEMNGVCVGVWGWGLGKVNM